MLSQSRISPMLTLYEVSELLHVHPNTLRRWSNSGKLIAHRLGPRGDRRFKREDVLQFIVSNQGPRDAVSTSKLRLLKK